MDCNNDGDDEWDDIIGGVGTGDNGTTDEHDDLDPRENIIYRKIIFWDFYAQPEEYEIQNDANVDQISDKRQWLAELLMLGVDIAKIFQSLPPASSNVFMSMTYDEFEDGALDNFTFSIDNHSGVNVYLSTIKISVNTPDLNPSCTTCGDFVIRNISNPNNYLATVKPRNSESATICSNCWGSPGIVTFLPIQNGNEITITPYVFSTFSTGFDGFNMQSITLPAFR